MRSLILAVIVFLGLFSTGCASIISGESKTVSFVSTPPGVPIEIVNAQGVAVHHGTTPFTLNLKRGDGYFTGAHYTVRVPGTPYQDIPVKTSLNAWYIGNVGFLWFCPIGFLIVDPVTGAMYTLPDEVHVEMGPKELPPAPAPK